jgi:CheY-like chemotaxis protein
MTITLEFPIAVAAAPAPAPAVAPKPTDRPHAPLRILLVEDHLDTLCTLADLLERLEHSVVAADSVHSALAAAQSHDFDLIISDLGLPDGSGTGLMQELRKHSPIRGIALTGYGTESDIQKTREAGFFAHLTKPIDFEQLQQAIKTGGSAFTQ